MPILGKSMALRRRRSVLPRSWLGSRKLSFDLMLFCSWVVYLVVLLRRGPALSIVVDELVLQAVRGDGPFCTFKSGGMPFRKGKRAPSASV